ncbi:nicotinamide-nucleotide adenylyltransferase [Paenibacillus cellulosilyticus]|uniref:Nicotinamide-nucleotide adenylyltransferase n=1 Tax=Paenibacillus cellulosilyticus TaxID=375489 RepID=A0A2V2YQC2_9BACL|nr:adenylyltransferase/cytidyltransferase family protein [Paenibacillus cellulosilyticus]PWV98626.1 nicotinamide-nucleotide adenylyltransferase [Paenibacillus cellulosilyticus]QKS43857.1 adenylyltransferase/cytidyltransferase family protein [Paenibacillus cellulosilyticus]
MPTSKPYRYGFILGRFQPLHIGHERMIDAALDVCDKVLVLVGSAQLRGTVRNPLDIELRARLLRKVYGNRIELAPLTDYSHEGDHSTAWGMYLLGAAKQYGIDRGFHPLDLMIAGDDEERGQWFPEDAIAGIHQLAVPRADIPISATLLREAVIAGEEGYWQVYTNPALHDEFETVRCALLEIEYYRERAEAEAEAASFEP